EVLRTLFCRILLTVRDRFGSPRSTPEGEAVGLPEAPRRLAQQLRERLPVAAGRSHGMTLAPAASNGKGRHRPGAVSSGPAVLSFRRSAAPPAATPATPPAWPKRVSWRSYSRWAIGSVITAC